MNITEHRHYRRWINAKARCYNPNDTHYKDYGGRGITMSDEFRNDPRAFCEYLDSLPGFGPEKTMDRTDNDAGYYRENLRWATRSQQQSNRRRYGKGITFDKRARLWKVRWRIDGKLFYYGYYKTKEEAIARAIETCPGTYRTLR